MASGAEGQRVVAAAAVHELPPGDSLLGIAEALRARPGAWWLDSALADGRLGRFSFAGAEPYAIVRGFGGALEVETLRPVRPDLAGLVRRGRGDPLAVLRALAAPPLAGEPASDLPFVGGAVGWLGYELAALLDPSLACPPCDALRTPDLALLLVDRVVALDHASGRRFACALGFAADGEEATARAVRTARALSEEIGQLGPGRACERGAGRAPHEAPPRGTPPRRAAAPIFSLDASAHAKAVADLLERIAAGDVYQANLTHRVERPFAGDAWRLYRALRARSPAPFAAWLSLPEVAVCSSSPERFLRLGATGEVESRPIKGTRVRGADPASDRALRAELAASEKDRAENLMIVDLVRHDLGRVCAIGSVHVPELRAIESYANVHHMVSTVRGRLRGGADVGDLVRAAFPPGSMTGAPKRAAMHLLAGLEPVRRGIYSGALGYFDARGGADLSVVIRTALVAGGRAYVHAGGGIVADSEARAEWRESIDKARAVWAAAEEAGE